MAKFLDKFLITTAVGKRHTKDLSCEHISTSNFMTFNVGYYRNLVPKEKIEINFRAFARLSAMPVPTFGRANMNCRCFFVPFRTVMPAWNDFITDAMHSYGDGSSAIPRRVRTIRAITLAQFLQSYSDSGTVSDYDFAVTSGGSTSYYKFSAFSRRMYKLLLSLGYAINWHLDGDTGQRFSALPLLALLKIYLDWYWPSAYVGDPDFYNLDSIIRRDLQDDELSYNEIGRMLNWLDKVCYDSDYFVSAFDNPTGPATGVASSVQIPDITSDGVIASNDVDDSGIKANTPFVPSLMTQFAVEALHRLTDYMKRHQLAGARSLDRYLARFGVNLSAEKLQRSVYLGNHVVPLMTGDVMSTANTYLDDGQGHVTGQPIGSYAGKGFLVGNDGHFEFETDEYGIMFIVYTIIPEVGYYQGIDRHNMHITRLDFFTPEFDAMGTRAISSAEVCLPKNPANNAWSGVFDKVFGYTPQYSEYKIGRDWLTGDFRIPSISRAGDTSEAWHLFRDLNDNASVPIVHSRSFVTSGNDDAQYNRIFYQTSPNYDHFYLHFFFGVKSTAPMKPLYDDYDFHDEDNAKRVMDVNGVKMN